MESYNFKAIEKKWQDKWEETGAFHAETNSKKPKYYTMIEFPYPSGAGLHVGHPRSYTALDIIARKRRMEGYNVLYPIGWDAFGLPTENFAIKNKVHPKIVTAKNIANFTRQLKMLGFSFDCQEKSTQPIRAIINGHSGYSYSFLSTDLHISRKCRLTGVPAVK